MVDYSKFTAAQLLAEYETGVLTQAEYIKILENKSEPSAESLDDYCKRLWESQKVEILLDFVQFFIETVDKNIGLKPDARELHKKFPNASVEECLLTISNSFQGRLAARKRTLNKNKLTIDGMTVNPAEYIRLTMEKIVREGVLEAVAVKTIDADVANSLKAKVEAGELTQDEMTNQLLAIKKGKG